MGERDDARRHGGRSRLPKRSTRKLGLESTLDFWLLNDGLWGGHDAANELRYLSTGGPGLELQVRDLLPQSDGTALGVATVRQSDRPNYLFFPQILFRFRPGAERLKALRVLPIDGFPPVGEPPHRIFRLGGRQLIQERDLTELRPSGAVGPVVKGLPPLTASLGASAGRWLLLRTNRAPGAALQGYRVYDARTGKGRDLPLGDAFPASDTWTLDPDRPYALIWVYPPKGGDEVWAVRLTDGHRARIDGNPQRLWDGYAVDFSLNPVLMWSADTGKLVASLPYVRR